MRTEELQDLLREAAAEHGPVDVASARQAVAHRAVRLRRRHRGRVGVAVSTAALFLVGALFFLAQPRGRSLRVATGPAAALPTSVIPQGWRTVDFDNARFAVPEAWPVVQGPISCGSVRSSSGVVLLGSAELLPPGCPESPFTTVRMQTTAPTSTKGRPVELSNGVKRVLIADDVSVVAYELPELGVTFTATGPQASAVAATLTASARGVALSGASKGAGSPVPRKWRTVASAGVTVRVPPSWPTRRLTAEMLPPGCGTSSLFPHPEVVLGSGRLGAFCGPGSTDGVVAPGDGVWIYPATFGQVQHATRQFGVGRLFESSSTDQTVTVIVPVGPDFVAIVVGLGSQGSVARTILSSLRTQ